ncbi:hypothetical protein D3C75_983150 [compost metagenome]
MPERPQRQVKWRKKKIAVASSDSKGRDLCEARNRERREIEGSHVPDRSRGAKKCVEPGNEHKEKPSGASTDRETEIAQATNRGPAREGERAWGNKSKAIALVRE